MSPHDRLIRIALRTALLALMLGAPPALASEPVFVQTGIASWYGPGFEGRRTASGSIYRQRRISAAHRRLPLGSVVIVTSLATGRSVRLTVTDRGPYVGGRILDLSRGAADALGIRESGISLVRIEAWPSEQPTAEIQAKVAAAALAQTRLSQTARPRARPAG